MLCVSILNTVTFKLEFLRVIICHEERESIFEGLCGVLGEEVVVHVLIHKYNVVDD